MSQSAAILGGLLIVDKESGLTSHDVVARCRRLLGTKKIGHAGTLDPMATGVLVLGVGRATKLLGLLSLTTKAYSATIRLGQATTTDDAEGEILSQNSAREITDSHLAAVINTLTGEIDQVPATVSAIKIAGKRAYARYRAGEEVHLAARPVTVSRFVVCARRNVSANSTHQLVAGESSSSAEGSDNAGNHAGENLNGRPELIDLDVQVECSSGTYVRALARDLGAALGVGGHLTSLRRIRVGPFTIGRAQSLEQLSERPMVTLDLDTAIGLSFPRRIIDSDQAEVLRDGGRLAAIGLPQTYAATTEDGRTIALLAEKGHRAVPVFVVRPRGLVD